MSIQEIRINSVMVNEEVDGQRAPSVALLCRAAGFDKTLTYQVPLEREEVVAKLLFLGGFASKGMDVIIPIVDGIATEIATKNGVSNYLRFEFRKMMLAKTVISDKFGDDDVTPDMAAVTVSSDLSAKLSDMRKRRERWFADQKVTITLSGSVIPGAGGSDVPSDCPF